MGEIRTFVDNDTHIRVLQHEIAVLSKKFNPAEEGTGHFNTAISVLQERIQELKRTAAWPFPTDVRQLDVE